MGAEPIELSIGLALEKVPRLNTNYRLAKPMKLKVIKILVTSVVHQSECNTIFCPPTEILVITHIKHVSLLRIKSFLHKKYVEEGLTINQIADVTMPSRSTVIKYLRAANIPIREEDQRIGGSTYGERRVNGRFVPNQKELELMKKIKSLKEQGLGKQQIANLLQGLNLPTKRGGKWSRKVVHTILMRMEHCAK